MPKENAVLATLKEKRQAGGGAVDGPEWGSAKMLSDLELAKLSRQELRNHLLARDLSAEGNKQALIERLEQSLEQERLSAVAYEETLEAEFLVQKDLEERGSVYAIGSNSQGQLGQGDLEPRHVFSVVPKSQGAGVCSVSAGFDLVFAITEDHDVFSWGGGGCGSMGHPPPEKDDPGFNEGHFMEIASVMRLTGEDIVDIKTGAAHCLGISHGGDLFVWGHNRCGQLGLGNFEACPEPELCTGVPENCTVTSFSVGENHSAIIVETQEKRKRVYTWGHVADGRLGVGVRERLGAPREERHFFPAPTLVDELYKEPVLEVSCGRAHTVLRSLVGVWSWGHGGGGRLGHGDQKDQFKPKLIEYFNGMIVMQISAATWHNAALVMVPPLKGCGELFTWGSGYHGQLGQGDKHMSLVPELVKGVSDLHIYARSISCGSHHNAMISHDGELWTWGSNVDKCLGRELDGFLEEEYTPLPGHVGGFGAIVDRIGRGLPRSVACGKEFTIVATYPYEGPTENVARTLMDEEALRREEEKLREEEEAAERKRLEKQKKKEDERAAREAARKAQKDKELGIAADAEAAKEKSALTSELLIKDMEASKHKVVENDGEED